MEFLKSIPKLNNNITYIIAIDLHLPIILSILYNIVNLIYNVGILLLYK